MRIRTQFIITMLLFGIILVIIAASAIITNHQVEKANKQERIASSIAQGASELSYLSNDYLMYRESQQRSRWQSRLASFFSEVASLNVDKPEQQALVRNIQANAQRLKEVFDSVVSATGNSTQNRSTALDPAFLQVSWSRMAVQSQGLVSDASRLSQLLHQQIDQLRNTRTMLMYVMVGLFGASLLASYMLTYRRILKSIVTLQAGAAVIGSGNLDFTIEEKRNDEIGDLSHAFNQMTINLKTVTSSKAELEREVTQRKQAEEDLRRQREWLRVTLTSIGDAVIASDTGGRITFLNPVAMTLTGWQLEEAMGQPIQGVFRIINEKTHKSVEDLVTRVLNEKCVVGLANDTVLLTKDGREVPIEDSAAPILDAAGDVTGVVLVFHDVTEKRRAQAALSQAHERAVWLARFPDENPNPVLRASADGTVLYCNAASVEIHGWACRVGEPLQNELLPLVGRAMAEGREVQQDVQLDERFYVVWVVPFPREGYANVYGRDITERKQAEKALRESEERFRVLAESMPVQISVSRARDGTILYVNRAYENTFGYDEGTLVGRKAPDLYAEPSDREALTAVIRERGGVANYEVRVRRVDGTTSWVAAWISSIEYAGEQAFLGASLDITERKRAEEALQQSEEYFRALAEALPQVVWTANAEGSIEWLNQCWYDYTGEQQGVGEGWSWEKSVHPDDMANTLTNWAVALRTGTLFQNEIRVRGHDGQFRWFLARAWPLRDRNGNVVRWFGTNTDVHDIKQMEETLRRSRDELEIRVQERTGELLSVVKELEGEISERKRAEEQLKAASLYVRSLIEASLDPLVTISRDGKVMDVNSTTELITGVVREQLIGSDFSDYFTEPDKARKGYQQVFSTGSVRDYPLAIRHASGRATEVLYNASLYRNERGEIQGVFAAARDVTELKSAEQERLRLVTAIEQAVEGIVIAHPDGRAYFANQAFERINGLSRKEVFGKNYYDILPSVGEEGGLFQRKVEEVFSYSGMWRSRVSRRKKNGELYDVDVTISPVREASGTVMSYVIIEHDVTQELRLQEHVRQWQKMEAIGTLAGGIAHDFNNILMPITINTELAFYDIPEGSPVRQYLQLVLDAASRGKELVKQITTFSRQKEQERRPVKISPVVKEGLKFLRSSLPKNIEIREIIEIESDVALVDPTQIHQILINLCNNGAYAMREKGGVLSISLTALEVDPKMSAEKPDLRPGPYLRLSVNDTGCGMERHVLEKVFDPFFTTKKKGEGTGMGLPVVAGIVRAHHGAITVSSEPGKGSMFSVFLPRIEGDPESDLDFKGLIPEGTERILFVDDEEAQAQTGALMLQRLGYRVVTRTDSEEALKLFKQDPHAIDLVVTDQSMPRMTGAKLAAELMRIRPDIPVILCTGFSETIDADEAKALGIREFVMKPFTVREMAETIRKALKK